MEINSRRHFLKALSQIKTAGARRAQQALVAGKREHIRVHGADIHRMASEALSPVHHKKYVVVFRQHFSDFANGQHRAEHV